jgi:pyruvate formate lyase activating enzyme
MITAEDKHRGTILRIQRMSTEDGPGIRSTVFFKGCPLACVWCHNPESISREPQVHWVKSRCIGCRSCIEACPKGALAFGDSGMTIDRFRCDSCSACVQACPSTAMEVYGEAFSAHDLVREVIKDKVYFQKSGGGVTLSGGEPTMQPGFTAELLSSFKQKGVYTALDTCGQCSWKTLEALLPHVDLVLYDLKEIDPENHKLFTGVTNKKILENIIMLGRFMKDRGMPGDLWIRTPLIPGCTATPENIKGIGAFIRKHLPSQVSRWDLCTFNNLCIHKYDGLGIDWPFKSSGLLDEEQANRLVALAGASGVEAGIVHLSGPMKTTCPYDFPDDEPHLGIAKEGTCR